MADQQPSMWDIIVGNTMSEKDEDGYVHSPSGFVGKASD